MNIEVLLTELNFKAMRSSGPGGQHVNKTASKIEVSFNIEESKALSDDEKKLLLERLNPRISSEGVLSLQCSESRSQHRNKTIVVDRLIELLQQNLKVSKPRKKTKPSKSSVEKRLKAKRLLAYKKLHRKPPSLS